MALPGVHRREMAGRGAVSASWLKTSQRGGTRSIMVDAPNDGARQREAFRSSLSWTLTDRGELHALLRCYCLLSGAMPSRLEHQVPSVAILCS